MGVMVAFERLDEMTDGDQGLAVEIAELFTQTTRQYICDLRNALGNADEWAAYSHALKGCCANFGAEALAEAAKQAEQSEPDSATVEQLNALFEKTCRALNSHYGVKTEPV